ncbi:MAG: hypothetical protein ABI581_08275, partial [Sediminibacterium sp.]
MNRRLFFFILLLLSSHKVCAQKLLEVTQPIEQKMEWYGAAQKPSALFVHFDKNIYASNETAWFTAYLIFPKVADSLHHTLGVSLVRNDDSSVIADHKFVMVNGLSFGYLVIPDSLQAGNYSFLVYTNVLLDKQPLSSFVQRVTIKSS